jgi:hypothetical protein
VELEPVDAGKIVSRKRGSGSDPIALSITIFNGTGLKSAKGVDNRLSKKITTI